MNAEDAEQGECTPGGFATDVLPSSVNPFFNILFSMPLGKSRNPHIVGVLHKISLVVFSFVLGVNSYPDYKAIKIHCRAKCMTTQKPYILPPPSE